MKQIIFDTTNPAKLIHVQSALDSLGIKVIGLTGFENLPEVVEDGKTAQENARKKALAYCDMIAQPVLSMDNALYFDGVGDDDQPGIHTRRIPGFTGRADDEQIIKYYSALFDKYGGSVLGHWEFAICLVFPDGGIKEITATTSNYCFTSRVHPNRMVGYPLESMRKTLDTGKYVVEVTQEERDEFWQSSIGKELKELFKDYE